jgi:hypothetical protein
VQKARILSPGILAGGVGDGIMVKNMLLQLGAQVNGHQKQ